MKSTYEFERRFLVADPSILQKHEGNIIVQAYLFVAEGYVVRVRRTHISTDESTSRHDEAPALLTTKGPRMSATREEYEWGIPAGFATELIKRAPWKISKTRYQIVDDNHLWDIDKFHGDNAGLVIAECEGHGLAALRAPLWCGREVTADRRYDNECLAQHPYQTWREDQQM